MGLRFLEEEKLEAVYKALSSIKLKIIPSEKINISN